MKWYLKNIIVGLALLSIIAFFMENQGQGLVLKKKKGDKKSRSKGVPNSIHCEIGKYFEHESAKCVPAEAIMSIPLSAGNLVIQNLNDFKQKQKIFRANHSEFIAITCTKAAPFYNGVECITCKKPYQLFNVSDLSCQGCNDDELYNSKSFSCEKIDPLLLLNLDVPKLILPKDITMQQLESNQQAFHKKHPSLKQKKCRQIRPYYNGEQCIQCEEPTPLFNMTSLQCTKCPSKYNQDSQLCEEQSLENNSQQDNNSE